MLKQRIITALIIAPIFIIGLFMTDILGFSLFLGLIVTIGGWEWARIVGWSSGPQQIGYAVTLAFGLFLSWWLSTWLILGIAIIWWGVALYLVLNYPASRTLWEPTWFRSVAGFLVLVPAWKALVSLHGGSISVATGMSTQWLILYILFIVWAADVGAYFAGVNFGKRKLAPNVSPGKSIEGAIGGMLAASLLPFIAMPLMNISLSQTFTLLLITVVSAMVSVLGDLLESMGKRVAGIKDSSQILPGHGGILDRIDSVTAAGPVFVLLAMLTGWVQV